MKHNGCNFDLVAFNVTWGLFGALFAMHDDVLTAIIVIVMKQSVNAHGPVIM